MNITTLNIGGVKFNMALPDDFIIHEREAAYREFFSQDFKNSGTVNIDVCLELDKKMDMSSYTLICDTRQAWLMYRKGSAYCLVLQPRSFSHPHSVVQFDLEKPRLTVYPGGKYITHKKTVTKMTNPLHYPLDQLLLMYILARRQGVLLHAAGINISGLGFVFPGSSGAGKSTLVRQFMPQYRNLILSDDRIIIRNIKNRYQLFGTPWPGEAGNALNQSLNLNAFFFLNKATANRITELKSQQAMEKLLHVTSIPWFDANVLPDLLESCQQLTTNIPCYDLFFKPDTGIRTFLQELKISC